MVPLFQGAYLGVSVLLERQQKEVEVRSPCINSLGHNVML